MCSGIRTKLVSWAGLNLPRRRDFESWEVRGEIWVLLDESDGMVVLFCGSLLVFWALWLVHARSAMMVSISVMCFILR